MQIGIEKKQPEQKNVQNENSIVTHDECKDEANTLGILR